MLKAHTIHGIAHITGGGLTENIVRVLDKSLGISIDLSAWQQPAIFNWLQQTGPVTDAEMRRTFNCGIGLVLVVPNDQTESVLKTAEELGERACRIGEVLPLAALDAQAKPSRVQYQR